LEVRLLKYVWRSGLATVAAGIVLAGCQRQQFTEATAGQAASSDSTMVVSASPYATRVGARILRSGGNAVDAAVGVAFALTVTYPTAGNIGGGGLMLARMNGETFALDFRERAPLAATRDMYLDAVGNPTDRSVTGALAVGVPGSVAGLYSAHQKFGALPWRDIVAPAIELAENGFAADSAFVEDIDDNMARFSAASAALYAPDGVPVKVGARFKNPDLAHTLRLIADQGAKGFYEGETAEKLVAEMQRDSGIISLEDLMQYEPKWRTPVTFTYRGHQVLTMPPVSSGGLTFALIANILGGYDLRAMGAHSADAIHVMAEAERVAFARRNTLLADPDFVPTPGESFLSPDTATALRARISMAKHTPDRVPTDPVRGQHTTHFSVVDGKGNAVALTTTLNTGFGSAVTVTGAGFLLNNEMDDFTVTPGALNQMGLRQGEVNAIVPGKRMLSSMTPTIVLDSTGGTFLVVGASGGARIITAVAQVVSNVVDFRMPLDAALKAPRFHAQDYPDRIDLTVPGIPDSVVKALESRGHTIRTRKGGMGFGWAQAIIRTGGRWHGVSEPAGHGLAAGY
jgi:gamma-glutamyltranspeptidase/glutathione hydrolase